MSMIPDYTPQRAYLFQREQQAVRAKLAKLFKLDSVPSPAALERVIGERVDRYFKESDWEERCRDCARHSQLPWDAHKQEQLDAVAKPMLCRVLEGDKMFRAVTDDEKQRVYHEANTFRGEALVEIYLNHITREGISHIKSLGFSDRSAVSLAGQVIRKAVAFASGGFSVKPYYEPAESVEKNTAAIYTHWKLMRDVLNDEHAASMKTLFGAQQSLQ